MTLLLHAAVTQSKRCLFSVSVQRICTVHHRHHMTARSFAMALPRRADV